MMTWYFAFGISTLLGCVLMPDVVVATTLTDLDTYLTNVLDVYTDKESIVPVPTSTDTLTVYVDIDIISISEKDAGTGDVTVTGYLTTRWTETRVTRVTDDVELAIPASRLWVPEITLINALSEESRLAAGTTKCRFNFKTGVVVWKPLFHTIVTCATDFKFFPFDEYKCSLLFTSTQHTANEVLLKANNSFIGTISYKENGDWMLKQTSAAEFEHGGNAYIEYKFTILRSSEFYPAVLVYPILLTSILHLFVFLVPRSSNQRLKFSMASNLAVVVLFAISATFIPKDVSLLPLILYYIFMQMFSNALVTVTVILTMKLGTLEGTESGCLMAVIRIFCKAAKACDKRSNRVEDARQDTNSPNPATADDDEADGMRVRVFTPVSAWEDGDNKRQTGAPTTLTSSDITRFVVVLDVVCFISFLLMNACCTIGFLVPISLDAE